MQYCNDKISFAFKSKVCDKLIRGNGAGEKKELKMHLTVETAMVVFECDRSKAIEMFKVLNRLGVARFVKGRRGWPSRLESN